MNILDYLKPDNPLALGIVKILLAIFLFWMAYFLYQLFSLIIQKKNILKCSDVDGLADELLEIVNQEEEKNQEKNTDEKKSTGIKEEVELMEKGEKAFSKFCRGKNIKEKGVVIGHLKTIFEAGIRESRLDVGELIKHTNNRLFRGNTLLKSLLASFIVLGLLGTLVGLADSLAGLTPVLGTGAAEKTSADLSSGLSALFTHLKTAFAPSIWGVFLTVFGVVFFSFYLRGICYPVKKEIENHTLTIWVPKLFLSTTQRLVGTFRAGEKQLRESMEAIKDLAKAEGVGEAVKDLQKNLKESNETLEKLSESAGEMKDFTGEFVEGAKKLSSFKDELQALYNQMQEGSEALKQNVQKSIEDSQEFQKRADETFKKQNEQLEESYRNLSSYEAAYVEERKKIDAKLKEVLDSARNAYDKLSERNVDVLGALGKPMAEKLQEIRHSLDVELSEITRKFDAFDVPIRKAADKIEMTVESFNSRTKVVTDEMRREFSEQNNKISENLDTLFSKVDNYADQLSETNRNQAKHSEILGTNVSLLSGNIEKLDGSFNAFDEFTKAERGKLDKRIIELTEKLHKEFVRQNKDTNENLESLFKKFEKYDSQLMETNKLQAEQAKTLGKDLSTFSDSIGTLEKSIDSLGKITERRDDTLEKLRPLSDVADKMGTLVQQLRNSSLMQEKQNREMAKKMDNMANAVQLLARGISEQGGIKLPKNVLAKNEARWNPGPHGQGIFNFSHSPIVNFFKRLFGKEY